MWRVASALRRMVPVTVRRIQCITNSSAVIHRVHPCPVHSIGLTTRSQVDASAASTMSKTPAVEKSPKDKPATAAKTKTKRTSTKKKETNTVETTSADNLSPTSQKSSNVFSGLTFCVTGKFSMTRTELHTLLEAHGAQIANSVTSKCTHLLIDPTSAASSKTKKAEQLDIPMVTEEFVKQSIEKGELIKETSPLYFLSPNFLGTETEELPNTPAAPAAPVVAQRRAQELREELKRASDLYYGSGKDSGLTDAKYDELFNELQKIESEHPSLRSATSPTQLPGGPKNIPETTAVKHLLPMLSLQSCTDLVILKKWDTSLTKGLLKLGAVEELVLSMERHPPIVSRSMPKLRYNLELKYDGIAVSMLFSSRTRKLLSVRTRGSGTVGEEITASATRWVGNLPKELKLPTISADANASPLLKDLSELIQCSTDDTIIEVRGEILLRTSSHTAWTAWQRENNPAGDDGANTPARNLAAGLIRRDMNLEANQPESEKELQAPPPLTFIAYGLHVHHPRIKHVTPYLTNPPGFSSVPDTERKVFPQTQSQVLELLEQLGLPTSKHESVIGGTTSKQGDQEPHTWTVSGIDAAISILQSWSHEKRQKLDFAIDGIVLKLDDLNMTAQLGATSHHPKASMAYKFPAKMGESILREVTWQVGREGKITPVAIFDAVNIDGVSVGKASLHNCAVFSSLELSVGDRISIERRGDVIPYVAGKISEQSATSKYSQPIPLPSRCPCSLRSKLEERAAATDEERFDLYCTSPACPIRQHVQIEHYCSKGSLDIVGLGKATIAELIELGFLSTPEDILDLPSRKQELLDLIQQGSLPGWGEKRVTSICENILSSHRAATQVKLLVAAGIPRLGQAQAKVLLARFGTINAVVNATEEEISTLPGFGPKLVPQFLAAFDELSNGLLQKWKEHGLLTTTAVKAEGGESVKYVASKTKAPKPTKEKKPRAPRASSKKKDAKEV